MDFFLVIVYPYIAASPEGFIGEDSIIPYFVHSGFVHAN